MKLIKVEYSGKSSQGIYANVTYNNFFGKTKTKEVFLQVFNFRLKNYSTLPEWVDSGKILPGMNFYRSVAMEMIRQYELNQK